VYLCIIAERHYATGISQLFDLGFTEDLILGDEQLISGNVGIASGSVIIDDLPPVDQMAMFKRGFLGIGPERQFRIQRSAGWYAWMRVI
jgi:hypothetical protein